jgi:maleate isomerase
MKGRTMYGELGRIGLMVPSVNTVVEPETAAMSPDGVSVYATRLRNSRSDLEGSEKMLQHVERAADELASAGVDVIAFACTASSFIQGLKGEEDLKIRIEGSSGVRAVTTSGAVSSALTRLGLKRIVLLTPYSDELNKLERHYLNEKGFEVLADRGMGIVDAFSIGKVEPDEVHRFALEILKPEVDGLFVSCTNLRTIEIIDRLEEETGKPVVTSNQATFWACLRSVGYSDPISGYGSLLAILR